jgi:Ca-activated chloride channel homolog
MSRFRRSLWLYPLFQIPLMFLGICLVLAALFWLLGLGRPSTTVTIFLDLSRSTYREDAQYFNAPDTVKAQEIVAVQAYVNQNSQLRIPNEIQVFGFGGQVVPLSSSFTSDKQKIEAELKQALQDSSLITKIGEGTNITQAIEQGTNTLINTQKRCRQLLLVTDGEADVSSSAIDQAITQKVRINAVVVGENAPALESAAHQTGGIYLSATQANLQRLFVDRLFAELNTNLKWIMLWLGGAWIALMWMLTLPLDRWIFQNLFKLPMNLSGQLGLGNALFWSVVTPLIVWQLLKLFNLPFFSSC